MIATEHPTSNGELAREDSRPTNVPLQIILTVAERAALLECEAIIRTGRAVFVQVGQALSRIRDSRLYRENYSTFEEYCLEVWEISDRFARNLRSAADVVHVLEEKNFAVLPATESQARPLTKLPREDWAGAWRDVLRIVPNGRVTTGAVAEVVQRRINRMAGISSDTEVVTKESKVQSPRPKVIEAGTREQRIINLATEAKVRLMQLADAIGTADGVASANVFESIHGLDELQDHLRRKEGLLANRQKKETGDSHD